MSFQPSTYGIPAPRDPISGERRDVEALKPWNVARDMGWEVRYEDGYVCIKDGRSIHFRAYEGHPLATCWLHESESHRGHRLTIEDGKRAIFGEVCICKEDGTWLDGCPFDHLAPYKNYDRVTQIINGSLIVCECQPEREGMNPDCPVPLHKAIA